MTNHIFCVTCCFSNKISNNFCSNCGKQLIKPVESVTLDSDTKVDINFDNYEVLKNKLIELAELTGYITVSIGHKFVQFLVESDRKHLFVDLGTIDNIPDGYIEVLAKKGFVDNQGFINKKISLDNKDTAVEQALIDTKFIIEIAFALNPLEKFIYKAKKGRKKIVADTDADSTLHKVNVENKNKTTNNGKAIFFIILIGIILIGYCSEKSGNSNNNSGNRDEAIETEIVTNSPYDASVRQVEDYLKNQYLKDPDSYQSISWSTVVIQQNKDYKYFVRHNFRAKNSFGGYVVESKIFYLDANGTVVDVKDFVE